MRQAILAAILCLCPAVSWGYHDPSAAKPSFRTWTYCTGLDHFDAEVVLVSDSVLLKQPNGKEIRVELDKLCKEDIAYLKDWRKTHKTLGDPPELLKSDAEKAADKINGLVKKINDQIDAVASEDTATRRSVAYQNIIRTLDSEIKNNVYELRFPIDDVKDDADHTLTLSDPEGIDDQVWHMSWFVPKYPTDKAKNIHKGDAFLIRGHGRLVYNYNADGAAHASLPKATCVIEFHNAVSKQYYALYLQDFTYWVEHVISVEVAGAKKPETPSNNPTASSAAPPNNGTASSSAGGNSVAPAATPTLVQAAPTTLPAVPAVQPTPPFIAPPPQFVVSNPPPPIFGPSPTIPTETAPAQTPPPSGPPPAGSGIQQPPYGKLCVPHYNFNIDTPAANKVRATLTPERQDQRYPRMRKLYDEFERYHRMPAIEVGANYRYEFWWYLDTWDAARKAKWLYNLHDVMEWDLYVPQRDTPGVAEELQKLEKENKPRDPYYVDAHFEDDPDLMYTDEFVDAIYEKAFTMNTSWATDWGFMCGICIVGGVILIAWARYSEWF